MYGRPIAQALVFVAFALVAPLTRSLGDKTAEQREAAATTLAPAISASHGLIALSPLPIAAAAILGADWIHVAFLGAPLAIVVVAFGASFSRWSVSLARASDLSAQIYPRPLPERRGGGFVLALCLAALIPLALLTVQDRQHSRRAVRWRTAPGIHSRHWQPAYSFSHQLWHHAISSGRTLRRPLRRDPCGLCQLETHA